MIEVRRTTRGCCQPARVGWRGCGGYRDWLGILLGILTLAAPVAAQTVAAQTAAAQTAAARTAAAQPATFDEVGQFFVQNYGPEDYDAGLQNFGVVQAPDGLVYAANVEGVLQFDGVSWRLIPIANGSGARSVAVARSVEQRSAEQGSAEQRSAGTVFVGAVGELGYLAPDDEGSLGYVSLLEHIAPEDREFGAVWRIQETSRGVYFRTYERLFRWDGRQMKAWRAESRFGQIFTLGDTLYVYQRGLGLMRMADEGDGEQDAEQLELAPDGGRFQDATIYGLLPDGDDAYLAVTRLEGMFRCSLQATSEPACRPFGSETTERLVELQPYHAVRVSEDLLAIATLRGGAALLDGQGRLLRLLNEASGLRSELVLYAYVDPQGGLWLGLNNGLARIELAAPLSTWGKTAGLVDQVASVARHRGRLYAATTLGVHVLTPGADGAASTFEPSPGVSAQCFALLSTPQGLLAGCGNGLFNLDRERSVTAISMGAVLAVVRGRRDPSRLFLGLSDGLAQMRLRDGEWSDFERFEAVQVSVLSVVEDDLGRLWLGAGTDGVMRFDPAAAGDAGVVRFDAAEGLPAGTYVTRRIAERVAILAPGGGLWRPEGERIVPDTTFQAFLPQGVASIQDLTEDNAGRVWISAGEASGVARPTDSGAEDVAYAWQPTALRRAATRSTDSMFAEPDGPLWLGGPNGLIRFDTRHVLEPAEGFPVSIRRVTTSGGTRLYDGQPRDTAPELPFADNNLRFAFAAPRLDAPERTQYRVRLDGLDDTWSPWSTEQDKDYTTLWEGRYVFRVQARDVYGFLSREDSLAFRILPPWYRSLWAYALYLLAFAAAVAAFVQFYRRKLARERAVSARLREVDRLKDEFLANTSHELRTPLNGITGLAESLIDGATGTLPDETRRNLSMIAHSGRRLSRLVDDILDFSKLRHHSLNLELRRVDLRALADVVLTLSRSLVGDKALELVNAVPADLPAVAADENRLQQILHNLVGNAIKFTDAGTVEVSAEATQGSGHETVEVRVADSGIGIPLEKQARIFDAFEQADASIEREYGGTGLGLAVTRQLVELHGGKIRVTSQPGEGSTFRFTLRVAEEGRVDPVASTPTVRGGVEPELPQTIRPGAAPSAAEAPAAAAEPSSAASAARILAVDDDPVNLQVLRNFLAVEDFDLTLASSGEEALRLVQHHSFDLVLLDVMMPKLSGYEVCRALRQQHPIGELPVVFLTAKSRDADVVSGMALGANDYLTKPVSKDRLLARVRPHLELLEIHRNLEGLVEEKMAQIKVLSGMLPICAGCKKVRDDEGYWNHLELYIKEHSEATFSHGICPECAERFYAKHPELRSEAEIKS